MNFFQALTRNVIKWWQLQIMPIFNLDNNRRASDPIIRANQQVPVNPQAEPPKPVKVGGEDAMEVLNRINKEKEEARMQAILKARQEAEEKARVAAIMNANKVDVDSFIQAGKEAYAENQVSETGANTGESAGSANNSGIQVASAGAPAGDADEEARKQEELRRAQEIIDRLNREAAEDEAKKEAEVAAAKQAAAEKFG